MSTSKATYKATRWRVSLREEYLGRGPQDVKTIFLGDMILVRLRGILTMAELKLAESREGRELVKESRRQLFESSRPLIEDIVQEIASCSVISLHTDMSTKTRRTDGRAHRGCKL